VLGIEEDGLPQPFEIRNGVGDHRQVLFCARFQDLPHLEHARLADQRDARRLGGYETLDVRVRFAGDVRFPRPAESAHLRVFQLKLAQAAKVLGVFRVGAGETAFHPLEPEFVEFPGNFDLVLDRKGDALHLRAVAEGGVIKLDAISGHGARDLSPETGYREGGNGKAGEGPLNRSPA